MSSQLGIANGLAIAVNIIDCRRVGNGQVEEDTFIIIIRRTNRMNRNRDVV